MTKFSLINIHKSFGTRKLLEDVSLHLDTGRCCLLTGANGTGKSTLLRICAGLEKPDAGLVDMDGGPVSWRRARAELQARTVYLHQQPFMFDGSVLYNLDYALRQHSDRAARREQIDMVLHWAGLQPIAHSWAKTLSGGERQRVALARAWLCEPSIMLLDEPTNNLDEQAKRRTIALLRSLKAQGIALLIASHEPEYFESLADEALQLADGRLGERTLAPAYDDNILTLTQIRRA